MSITIPESKLAMLSLPNYAGYELGSYFYVAAGPVIDFQLTIVNGFADQTRLSGRFKGKNPEGGIRFFAVPKL